MVIYNKCSISSSAELTQNFCNIVQLQDLAGARTPSRLGSGYGVGSGEAQDVGDGPAARIAVGLPR